MTGKPIRVQWTREDEFAWEPYGPAMAVMLEADLDASGNIVSWRHDLWSNGHTHRPGRSPKPVLIAGGELANPFERSPAVDPPLPVGGAQRNAVPGYEFPVQTQSLAGFAVWSGDASNRVTARFVMLPPADGGVKKN